MCLVPLDYLLQQIHQVNLQSSLNIAIGESVLLYRTAKQYMAPVDI